MPDRCKTVEHAVRALGTGIEKQAHSLSWWRSLLRCVYGRRWRLREAVE